MDDQGKIRQKLYFDRDMKGFGLCVGAKSKTFFSQREVRGRQVRVTIGRYGIFTADEARTEACQLPARMAKGENPNETKRAERARSVTFGDALEFYLAQPTGRGGTPRSLKTLQDYRSSAERHLKNWLDQPLADTKRRDVYDKHRKIASNISDSGDGFPMVEPMQRTAQCGCSGPCTSGRRVSMRIYPLIPALTSTGFPSFGAKPLSRMRSCIAGTRT